MHNPSVFMIGWEYPPHNSGGLGVACEGLTTALADQNTQIYFTLPYRHSQPLHHMSVIACVDPKWELSVDSQPFSAYSSVATLKPQTSLLDAEELHALPGSELEWRVDQYRDLVAEQARLLQNHYDVVHAHDWMTFPAAQKIKHQTGRPFVAHVHSTEYDRIPSGTGSPYIHQTEYEGLHQADRIIVVSYYTKKLLIDKYQIDPQKIEVIHNGVPPVSLANQTRPQFASRRPVIVFMGRLTGQKGPEQFLAVARQVLADLPDALFLVAGHGDMYRQLLVSTATQGLSASVLFTGFLRGKEREQLLQRADIFLMPSLSEPFGLVAMEAAQRRTPVIVSKTSGVSEVLPSAISIDFWDINKMSQTIKSLLANRPAQQLMVRKQLKNVEQVTWQKAASAVNQVYRRAFLGE